jgi:hypothetical protein
MKEIRTPHRAAPEPWDRLPPLAPRARIDPPFTLADLAFGFGFTLVVFALITAACLLVPGAR